MRGLVTQTRRKILGRTQRYLSYNEELQELNQQLETVADPESPIVDILKAKVRFPKDRLYAF